MLCNNTHVSNAIYGQIEVFCEAVPKTAEAKFIPSRQTATIT